MGSGWVSEGAGSGKAFNRQLRSGGRSEPHWNGESQNDFSATHPTNLLLQTHSHGFPKAWQPLGRREKKKERERGIVSVRERERESERASEWFGWVWETQNDRHGRQETELCKSTPRCAGISCTIFYMAKNMRTSALWTFHSTTDRE